MNSIVKALGGSAKLHPVGGNMWATYGQFGIVHSGTYVCVTVTLPLRRCDSGIMLVGCYTCDS